MEERHILWWFYPELVDKALPQNLPLPELAVLVEEAMEALPEFSGEIEVGENLVGQREPFERFLCEENAFVEPPAANIPVNIKKLCASSEHNCWFLRNCSGDKGAADTIVRSCPQKPPTFKMHFPTPLVGARIAATLRSDLDENAGSVNKPLPSSIMSDPCHQEIPVNWLHPPLVKSVSVRQAHPKREDIPGG